MYGVCRVYGEYGASEMYEVCGAYEASVVNGTSGCVECIDRLKWMEFVRYMERLWWMECVGCIE